MQAFIAGIQDVIEPTFTFVLAWALGTAMQVHTQCKLIAQIFQFYENEPLKCIGRVPMG